MTDPAARPRSALLLSGSIGMGHDALAAACAVTLEQRGFGTQTLDAMRLLGKQGNSAGEAVFRAMLAVPGLFDAFHFAALRPGGALARFADAAASRQVVPRLRAYLDQHPADLAISVFSTGAAAVSRLAERYPAMSHVVFSTDVTPHRLWVQRNVDLYLVTSAGRRGGRPAVRAGRAGPGRAGARPARLLPGAVPGRGPGAPVRPARGTLRAADVRAPGASARSPPRPRPSATPACTCWPSPGATPGSSGGWPPWPPASPG